MEVFLSGSILSSLIFCLSKKNFLFCMLFHLLRKKIGIYYNIREIQERLTVIIRLDFSSSKPMPCSHTMGNNKFGKASVPASAKHISSEMQFPNGDRHTIICFMPGDAPKDSFHVIGCLEKNFETAASVGDAAGIVFRDFLFIADGAVGENRNSMVMLYLEQKRRLENFREITFQPATVK